jgi:hypothetical protein
MRLIDYLFNSVKGYKKGYLKIELLSKDGSYGAPISGLLIGDMTIELLIEKIPRTNEDYEIKEFEELKREYHNYKSKAQKLFNENIEKYIQTFKNNLDNLINEYEQDVNYLFEFEGEEYIGVIMGRTTIEEYMIFLVNKIDLSAQKEKLRKVDINFKNKSKQLLTKYPGFVTPAAREVVELYPDEYWWWHLDKI